MARRTQAIVSTPSSGSGWGLIEDTGKALALGAVLLPVTGVLVRLIAFSVAETVNRPLDLALAESPAELITNGVDSLLVGLFVLPLFAVWAYQGIRWAPYRETST